MSLSISLDLLVFYAFCLISFIVVSTKLLSLLGMYIHYFQRARLPWFLFCLDFRTYFRSIIHITCVLYTIVSGTLSISMLLFTMSVCFLLVLDPFFSGFLFFFYTDFGVDGLAVSFLFIVALLGMFCLDFVYSTVYTQEFALYYYFYILCFVLFYIFLVVDLLSFYIFFELLLIPFYLIILQGSTRKRRVFASFYLVFFTMLGSLFLLLSLSIWSNYLGLVLPIYFFYTIVGNSYQWFLTVLCFLGFAVKIPTLPFHTWLPEAHVEASTEGSVLLAALILKLSMYGFYRFWFLSFVLGVFYLSSVVVSCSVLSLFCSGLVALRQIDLKRIIAYSSISHMNVILLSVYALTDLSTLGSLVLLVGHSFCAAGLFFTIGSLYQRYHTKLLYYYSSLRLHSTWLSLFFFIFIISNVSIPFTLNFVGELLLLCSLVRSSLYIEFIFLFWTLFFCLVYSFLLFSKVNYGTFQTTNLVLLNSNKRSFFFDITRFEFIILGSLSGFLLFLGLYPGCFLYLFKTLLFNHIQLSLHTMGGDFIFFFDDVKVLMLGDLIFLLLKWLVPVIYTYLKTTVVSFLCVFVYTFLPVFLLLLCLFTFLFLDDDFLDDSFGDSFFGVESVFYLACFDVFYLDLEDFFLCGINWYDDLDDFFDFDDFLWLSGTLTIAFLDVEGDDFLSGVLYFELLGFVLLSFFLLEADVSSSESLIVLYKYIINSCISGLFFFFGYSFLVIQDIISMLEDCSLIFIFIGFLFKMYLFPFCFWLEEFYDTCSLENLPGVVLLSMSVYGFFLDWVDAFSSEFIYGFFALVIVTGFYGLYLSGTTTSITTFFSGGSLILSTYVSFLLLCDCDGFFTLFLITYISSIATLVGLLSSVSFYSKGNGLSSALSFSDFRGLGIQNSFFSFKLLLAYLLYSGFVPFSVFLNKFFFLVLVSINFGYLVTGFFLLLIFGVFFVTFRFARLLFEDTSFVSDTYFFSDRRIIGSLRFSIFDVDSLDVVPLLCLYFYF